MSIGPSAAARPSKATVGATVAAVVRILAAQGTAALPDVLQLVAAAVGCEQLQIRAADAATVLATAQRAPAPAGRRATRLDIPIRRAGQLCGVLAVTATRSLTDSDARLLAATADAVALALAADGGAGSWTPGRAVLDEEADRAQVAATLLGGVGEALVSVRYAAELVAAGREGRSALEEPVRAALAALRHAQRDLRAHALESGLRAALLELPERWAGDRPDDGMPELRLSVTADDPGLDALAPPVAVTVQRVAEAALRGATGRAWVRASCDGQRVKLRVDSAEIAYDASELDRWARRALALGGDLRRRPDGVELSLPAELLPDRPALEPEGRHDDGSDL